MLNRGKTNERGDCHSIRWLIHVNTRARDRQTLTVRVVDDGVSGVLCCHWIRLVRALVTCLTSNPAGNPCPLIHSLVVHEGEAFHVHQNQAPAGRRGNEEECASAGCCAVCSNSSSLSQQMLPVCL